MATVSAAERVDVVNIVVDAGPAPPDEAIDAVDALVEPAAAQEGTMEPEVEVGARVIRAKRSATSAAAAAWGEAETAVATDPAATPAVVDAVAGAVDVEVEELRAANVVDEAEGDAGGPHGVVVCAEAPGGHAPVGDTGIRDGIASGSACGTASVAPGSSELPALAGGPAGMYPGGVAAVGGGASLTAGDPVAVASTRRGGGEGDGVAGGGEAGGGGGEGGRRAKRRAREAVGSPDTGAGRGGGEKGARARRIAVE